MPVSQQATFGFETGKKPIAANGYGAFPQAEIAACLHLIFTRDSIFTRATLCVKRVIAVASCPSVCLAVCLSQPVLYENGNS